MPSATLAADTRHVLLIKATDIDVARAARTVSGVRKVTREAGEIWIIASDLDVNAAIAQRIVADGGSLKLLVSVKPGQQRELISCIANNEASTDRPD